MGTGFSNARGTAAIFPENFYREPVRPVERTCVQVVTSWPPQFGSFLIPPSPPLFRHSMLLNSAARFAGTQMRFVNLPSRSIAFTLHNRSDEYAFSDIYENVISATDSHIEAKI